MTFSHLIAVNCHPFHALSDIREGLASVVKAAGIFRQRSRDRVDVRVFWHNPAPLPEDLRLLVDTNGFELVEAAHESNGANLNKQIDAAAAEGFDIFFRVDGDDTVTAQRFLKQAELLKHDECDICGAGLLYKPAGGNGFVVLPEPHPGARDYLENKYLLHPTMAFRIDRFRAAGLRYWTNRLEDKALLLAARKAGLRVMNIPVVAGGYNVGPRSRNRLVQKWLGLRLNLAFLWHTRNLHLVPYALALFTMQVAVGSQALRVLRYRLHRRNAASLRTGGSTQG
ncbi:hypothetical protein E4Z66_00255 [Aliishimia ponticola]|uniref:Glycosyltransferase family 2 protein n=1 Tax=Aliishimia ponticola TaxID=2499833 RepID=A0A4S4NES5_9RHOB|nr:hypothetical protein [Aliishimia ponticola]THH38046.1 hypothetical protein E4Z66_00255 [Aliishimia ponticola]